MKTETRIVSLLSGGVGFYHGAVGMKAMLSKYAREFEHVLMIESYKYTPQAIEYLESIGWQVVPVPALRTQWTKFAAKRWPNTFTKVNLWNLPFEKVIYLDLDAVPLRPLSLLDEATRETSFAVSVFPKRGKRFRSGVMVLRPDPVVYGELVELLKRPVSENGAKLGDQGLLNIYFRDRFDVLPHRFHGVEIVRKDTVIRHIRPKPWEPRAKGKHVAEWRSAYNLLRPQGFEICRR